MYKVALIVNENEVSHSKYADTLSILNFSIEQCNQGGRKGNSYHFTTFDKFNIQTFFTQGEKNIKTFDGIVIATNAMDNEKVYNSFYENQQILEDFINDDKGIFISSQKKLSSGSLTNGTFKSTGFLPDIYDYYVFDRPEKYSSDGSVTITCDNKMLFFPNTISNNLIKERCEKNNFMIHRYRSVIIPKHQNAYETLLSDSTTLISQDELGYLNSERKVLIVSNYNKRIVVSTMALDWANHSELLGNILTFITANKPPVFFVKKEVEGNARRSILETYIIRANIASLPYRVVSESEIEKYPNFQGSTFIFSPKWRSREIEKIYRRLLSTKEKYFSLYHIYKSTSNTSNDLRLSKYCNYSSIDLMKDDVMQKITSDYIVNSWHKSVWTYSYVIDAIKFFDIKIPLIAQQIYKELARHFTKKDEKTGAIELTGNYDNVFNATCKMADILCYFKNKFEDSINSTSNYKIDEVLKKADRWIMSKILSPTVSEQDVCYGAIYLLSNDRPVMASMKTKLGQLLEARLEEIFPNIVKDISSIDLCRIYQAHCNLISLGVYTNKTNVLYIKKIELILSERQDIYGNWRNISETAEIATMLIEVYSLRLALNVPLNTINVLIAKAIEILHNNYNPTTRMWSDDLNTTAKAVHAIAAYDKKFNFAINDFFIDLNSHQSSAALIVGTDIGIIHGFYRNIDFLEKEKKALSENFNIMEKSASRLKKQYKQTLRWTYRIIAILFFLTFITIILVHEMFSNYSPILLKIYNDLKGYFIGGFIGLAVSIAWEIMNNNTKKE